MLKKLLNKILAANGLKVISTTAPEQKTKRIYKRLTKAEISRQYNIPYSSVTYVHRDIIEKQPGVSRGELIRQEKEYQQAVRLIYRHKRSSTIPILKLDVN